MEFSVLPDNDSNFRNFRGGISMNIPEARQSDVAILRSPPPRTASRAGGMQPRQPPPDSPSQLPLWSLVKETSSGKEEQGAQRKCASRGVGCSMTIRCWPMGAAFGVGSAETTHTAVQSARGVLAWRGLAIRHNMRRGPQRRNASPGTPQGRSSSLKGRKRESRIW